ncbi:hypothetical protein CRP01_21525 [Flavilitoribacter nigricans DSM 23189 = NBRC 102662]|uniref:Uncharacterized protein n=1 Tax=Flavilitoribacter nigricans (strain ATCC 23147 / DSM 23189 / NBRC 102662 / NCIMB 1420 / SS-2) TaxID=1122177 RepID=A0A2D0N865_FLAN2|nr:hypothetical protein CRP01_21525 [Flavilitoribacter nigricans DSM 23189 = NBRC 102662]
MKKKTDTVFLQSRENQLYDAISPPIFGLKSPIFSGQAVSCQDLALIIFLIEKTLIHLPA